MKLLFLGDVFYRGLASSLSVEGTPLEPSDLCLANFEGVLEGRSTFENDKVLLGQSAFVLDVLRSLGVTHVSVANNHVLDHGGESLLNSIRDLRVNEIAVAGWETADDCNWRISLSGLEGGAASIFCVAHSSTGAAVLPGNDRLLWTANAEDARLLKEIEQARARHEIVVVYVHWGETNYRYPSPEMRLLARRWADAGANYVVGHHPHVVQGEETIGSCLVFYSLGNFLFDEYPLRKGRILKLSSANRTSLALWVEVSGGVVSHRVLRTYYDEERGSITIGQYPKWAGFALSAPLLLGNRPYGLFLKGYYLYRAFLRLAYWLAPTRIGRIGPRQFEAGIHLIKKFVRR